MFGFLKRLFGKQEPGPVAIVGPLTHVVPGDILVRESLLATQTPKRMVKVKETRTAEGLLVMEDGSLVRTDDGTTPNNPYVRWRLPFGH